MRKVEEFKHVQTREITPAELKKMRPGTLEDFRTERGTRKLDVEFYYHNGHFVSGPHFFNEHTISADIAYWIEKGTLFIKL